MPTAALPGTPTAPGTARPAPATQHPPRGAGSDQGRLAGLQAGATFPRDAGCGVRGQARLGMHLELLSWYRRSRRQDIRHGNPTRQCRGFNSNGERSRPAPGGWVRLLSHPIEGQPWGAARLCGGHPARHGAHAAPSPQPTRTPWSPCSTAWQAAQPSSSASPARPRPPLSGCSSEMPVTGAER